MPVSGLSELICLCGGIFGRAYSVWIKITQILHKLTSWGSYFQQEAFFAQLCRLPSNNAFPNTRKWLIFLSCSEAGVPRCSSKSVFLKFSKTLQKAPPLQSFKIKLQVFRVKTSYSHGYSVRNVRTALQWK